MGKSSTSTRPQGAFPCGAGAFNMAALGSPETESGIAVGVGVKVGVGVFVGDGVIVGVEVDVGSGVGVYVAVGVSAA